MGKYIACSIIFIGLCIATSYAFQQAVPHRVLPSSFPNDIINLHQCKHKQHRVNLIQLQSSTNDNQRNNELDKQLSNTKLIQIFHKIRRVVSVPSSKQILQSFILSLSIFLIILCGIPESSSAAVRSGGRMGGSFSRSSNRSRHYPSSSRSHHSPGRSTSTPRRNSQRPRSSRVYNSYNSQPYNRSYNKKNDINLSRNGQLNTPPSGSSSSSSSSPGRSVGSTSNNQSYNEQPNGRSRGYMNRGYNRGYLGIGRRPFYSGYGRGIMRGYNNHDGYSYSPYGVHVPYGVVVARTIGRMFFVSVLLFVAFFIL